jgi:protein-S-isoprenylcysteine O-methyltransferase Ste14
MRRDGALPPTYLLLGLLGIVVLHFTFPGPRLIGSPWRLIGVPAALLALWLTIRADALFKELGTEIKPFRRSSLVVDQGPFRFSRHPMYVGFLGILLGVAVLAGTLLPLLVVPAMFVLFTVRFVLPEERHMEEQFGEEYRSYRARVRRWL